jgi:hypothetical protein
MISKSAGFLLLAIPVLAGDLSDMGDSKSIIIPAPGPTSPWRIGAGVMWRNIGELSVDPQLGSSRFAGRFFLPPTGAGEIDSFADRTYDDGFVNIGAATPVTGLTTHWSCQNDSQIGGGLLRQTLSGGAAQTLPGSGNDDESHNAAPYLEISYLVPIRPDLVAGFTTNLSLARLDHQARSGMNNSSVSIVDHYALGGVIPPSAPYTGSFTGPGPLIPNLPASRDLIQTPNGTSDYRFAHDTDLYSLAFGGEIHWQPTASCYLGFGAGAVLNLADWSASWSAPVPSASGTTTIGSTNSDGDFLWGLYLKTSAGYRIDDRWSLEGFFRYDWNETLHGSVSPSSFELGLTGWSAGFGVSFRF